jgi:hypothetical protein
LKLRNVLQISREIRQKKAGFEGITLGFKSSGKALRGDEGEN